MEELQICNNILTVLDLSKLELSRLNQLDASNFQFYAGENSISVVGLPENMTDLEYLDFHKNRIDSLNLEKIRLPSLKYLDLCIIKRYFREQQPTINIPARTAALFINLLPQSQQTPKSHFRALQFLKPQAIKPGLQQPLLCAPPIRPSELVKTQGVLQSALVNRYDDTTCTKFEGVRRGGE